MNIHIKGGRLIDPKSGTDVHEDLFVAAGAIDAIVMHPGPINRGVEIDSAVADGSQAVILSQVTFGIAVRMAVMAILAGNA